jgi:DNA-binding transcriptional regulator GbsR (MarR family)
MSPDKQLTEILAILVNRFGTGRTIGEVYATAYALMIAREGGTTSIAEIAKATGCSKQNLSRWLQYQVDIGQAKTQPAEDDARKQEIGITDPMWAYRHLESLAEVLGCEVDLGRRK